MSIRRDHGDYVCECYETRIYTLVQQNHISDIKIDITDNMGQSIQFQAGKTIVTLHLRKQGLHISGELSTILHKSSRRWAVYLHG